jgi:hypothetical protein
MDRNRKLRLIDGYLAAVDPLIDFVKSSPNEALDFRPALPEAWTIREHAVHFLDADTFAYGRVRLCVTQPGAEVFFWDENAWQGLGCYRATDAVGALEIAAALRRVAADMAWALLDTDWDRYFIRHPVLGRLHLADVLTIYTDHADFHMTYLRRNLEAFERRA